MVRQHTLRAWSLYMWSDIVSFVSTCMRLLESIETRLLPRTRKGAVVSSKQMLSGCECITHTRTFTTSRTAHSQRVTALRMALSAAVVGLASAMTVPASHREKATYDVAIAGLGTVRGVTSNNSDAIAFFGGQRCVPPPPLDHPTSHHVVASINTLATTTHH